MALIFLTFSICRLGHKRYVDNFISDTCINKSYRHTVFNFDVTHKISLRQNIFIQGGREISAILSKQSSETVEWTIVYKGSKLDSFLRKRCFLFYFVQVVLLISLEIMRKNLHQ